MATALGTRPVIGVITNPNSKKNRRRHDRVQQLQAIVGEYGVVRQTPSTEAIGTVVGEFLDRGVDFWVSDGGDGALYWMLNSAHDVIARRHGDGRDFHRHLRYALPTNGGTIDYVARSAGVRGRAEDILKKLVTMYERGQPLEESVVASLRFEGVQELPDGTRRRFERVGFATAVAGIGNRFFEKYYRARIPGPKVIVEVVSKVSASYLLSQTPLARFAPPRWLEYGERTLRPLEARVEVDGRELPFTHYTALNAGAFKINLGGVLKFFPHAGKGLIHFMTDSPSPADMIANIQRMLTGRRVVSKDLHDAPGREMKIVATGAELLRPNIDGEFVDDVREMTIRPGPKFRVPRIDAKKR